MATLFISDLHLDADTGVEMLRHTLAGFDPVEIEDLYILGDLFEAWIGDDDDHPLATNAASLLAHYTERGWRIHFLPGNRDFLLGEDYLRRFGGRLLADPAVITVKGHRLLLLHGDQQCLADVQYQTVRKQLRDPAWQQSFLAQSIEQRRQFAEQARSQSQAHTSQSSAAIMDADADEIASLVVEHDAYAVIHGHTHRPAIHALGLEKRSALRVVLGAWHRSPSWLRIDAHGIQLQAEGNCITAGWPNGPEI